MAYLKNLVEGSSYIATYITGTEQGFEFGSAGKKLSTDTDGYIRWDGVKLLTEVDQYVLPTATASVKGGVIIGPGVSVDGLGTISVSGLNHTHTVSQITDFTKDLSTYNNTTSNFQNATQVTTAITNMLAGLDYVVEVFVSDGTDAYSNGDLVVKYKDGTTEIIWNLIAETNIAVVTGQDIININLSNSLGLNTSGVIAGSNYIVVNFGLATMTWTELDIPVYTGDDGTTSRIEITVNSSTRKISATLLTDAVSKSQLTSTLRSEIDNKIDLKSTSYNGYLTQFTSTGDITTSNITVSSINTALSNLTTLSATVSNHETRITALETAPEKTAILIDQAESNILPTAGIAQAISVILQTMRNNLKALFNKFASHTHDGVNSLQIDYGNLLNAPEQFINAFNITVPASTTISYSFFAPAATVKGVNVEYIVNLGSSEQYGTIMLRKYNRYFIEKDVFGDSVGVIFNSDLTEGSISIQNTNASMISIRFVVTYL